jgi:hypothetical protein
MPPNPHGSDRFSRQSGQVALIPFVESLNLSSSFPRLFPKRPELLHDGVHALSVLSRPQQGLKNLI